VAAACRRLGTPVIAVLGNHDWHCARRDEIVALLEDAGVCVLDPGHTVRCVNGVEVGIVGAQGFVGGFPGSHLPDFGEPSLRAVYAEAGEARRSVCHRRALEVLQEATAPPAAAIERGRGPRMRDSDGRDSGAPFGRPGHRRGGDMGVADIREGEAYSRDETYVFVRLVLSVTGDGRVWYEEYYRDNHLQSLSGANRAASKHHTLKYTDGV